MRSDAIADHDPRRFGGSGRGRAPDELLLEEELRQLPAVRQLAWSYGLPPGGGMTSFGDWISDAPGVPPLWNLSTEIGRAALDAEVSRQALTIAYINDFRFMMYLSLLTLPLLLVLRSQRTPSGVR